MLERYPLSLGEVSPGERFVRVVLPVGLDGRREGVHTGGPWMDGGGEIWKPLDALAGPGARYRERTQEDEILGAMSAISPGLFPQNWRVEERCGRRFLVRACLRVVPQTYPAEQVTREQVLQVEQMVRTINEHWWWINDVLVIAIDDCGRPVLLDLSSAQRANPEAQGIYRPDEQDRFEQWAEVVAGHISLVRLRGAAYQLVSSVRWARRERASGRARPRRWVYAASQKDLPPEVVSEQDCVVYPCECEGLGVQSWCVASGPLEESVLQAYGLELGWAPLQYKEAD